MTAAPTGAGSGATSSVTGRASTAVTATPDQETSVRITLAADGTKFTGTLDDNAASRSLLTQLPVELDMSDHSGVEKTGRLPSPLSLDGLPSGADPAGGDIGYYAPGQDLVLYYGDQSYYEGIVVLGRLDAGVDTLATMTGDVTVSVRVAD